jgi:glutamate--cysteine ligase catalytic subunit
MSRTLTANIRERRGSLVDIRVPIFIDKDTVLPPGTSAPESNGHEHIGQYILVAQK